MLTLLADLARALVPLLIGAFLLVRHRKLVEATMTSGEAVNTVWGTRETERQKRFARAMTRSVLAVLGMGGVVVGLTEVGAC